MGCSCIAAAFLAGNLHFFEFPRGLPKMQRQCSCNAAAIQFTCIFCIKSMILAKAPLKSSPKWNAAALQLHCSCIFSWKFAFFEFPKDLPKMQLQCSCNPIYLHFCIKSMILCKNTFKIQRSCIAAAFLAGNLQFFEFPRGLPKMQLQCSQNAAAMQLQCSCNAAAASQNAAAMQLQCSCSLPKCTCDVPKMHCNVPAMHLF